MSGASQVVYNNISSHLTNEGFKYYGEIISFTDDKWITGGQNVWNAFLNSSLLLALQRGVESVTFVRKNTFGTSIVDPFTSTCSNTTVASLIVQTLHNFSLPNHTGSSQRQYFCDGNSWTVQLCHTDVAAMCVGCSHPCYTSCAWSTALYPCAPFDCWSEDDDGQSENVSDIIHFFAVKPLSAWDDFDDKNEVDDAGIKDHLKHDKLAMILLIVFSVSLVLLIGIMVACYRTIRSRRAHRKEEWKDRQIAYEQSYHLYEVEMGRSCSDDNSFSLNMVTVTRGEDQDNSNDSILLHGLGDDTDTSPTIIKAGCINNYDSTRTQDMSSSPPDSPPDADDSHRYRLVSPTAPETSVEQFISELVLPPPVSSKSTGNNATGPLSLDVNAIDRSAAGAGTGRSARSALSARSNASNNAMSTSSVSSLNHRPFSFMTNAVPSSGLTSMGVIIGSSSSRVSSPRGGSVSGSISKSDYQQQQQQQSPRRLEDYIELKFSSRSDGTGTAAGDHDDDEIPIAVEGVVDDNNADDNDNTLVFDGSMILLEEIMSDFDDEEEVDGFYIDDEGEIYLSNKSDGSVRSVSQRYSNRSNRSSYNSNSNSNRTSNRSNRSSGAHLRASNRSNRSSVNSTLSLLFNYGAKNNNGNSSESNANIARFGSVRPRAMLNMDTDRSGSVDAIDGGGELNATPSSEAMLTGTGEL